MDKKALRQASYGVYIVTTQDGDTKAGCVINTFTQVTSTPARVTIALNKENFTTGIVQKAGAFEVSVLAEDAAMELIGRFGFHSGTDIDKFADTDWAADSEGLPFVREGAVAHVGARVIDTVDVGTHLVFVGEVYDAEDLSDATPMTYAYYHQVKGGKTPPKASSYDAEEAAAPASASAPAVDAPAPAADAPAVGKTTKWRCTICGAVVEIEGDELPADFTCPICGMGPEVFERID